MARPDLRPRGRHLLPNLLPPAHREAIDLRFFQQLTDREAARKIGTAPSTITKRVHAAIVQVRKLFSEIQQRL